MIGWMDGWIERRWTEWKDEWMDGLYYQKRQHPKLQQSETKAAIAAENHKTVK